MNTLFYLYLSLLLITGTALWAIASLPKMYLFKAFYIPIVLVTVLLLYFTYNAILGYATREDPPEIVQYIYHITNKDTNQIFLLLIEPQQTEPRLYTLPYNKELEEKLKGNKKARGEGVVVYGKLKRGSDEINTTDQKWIWYDMAPAEVMPKNYQKHGKL